MRYVAIILFSFLITIAKSQVDTIVIADDPLIINKEVYYTTTPIPIKTILLIGAGPSMSKGYQNESPSLVYKNDLNGFAFSTELRLSKGIWNTSIGLGYHQTSYIQQQNNIETINEEHSKIVSDTTLTYDIKWKEDVYYPGGGTYDTTYIYTIHTKDSAYTSSKDTIVTTTNTYRRKFVEIPLSMGYQFNTNKFEFVISATLAPAFLLNKNESSFLLHYGGAITALYVKQPN